jgi:hypothetical protein
MHERVCYYIKAPVRWRRADPQALKRAGKKKQSRPDSDPSPPEDSDSNGSNGSKAGQDASSRQPCPPPQEDDAVRLDITRAQRNIAHAWVAWYVFVCVCVCVCVCARARVHYIYDFGY